MCIYTYTAACHNSPDSTTFAIEFRSIPPNRVVDKEYVAGSLVYGGSEGSRHPGKRARFAYSPPGRDCNTRLPVDWMCDTAACLLLAWYWVRFDEVDSSFDLTQHRSRTPMLNRFHSSRWEVSSVGTRVSMVHALMTRRRGSSREYPQKCQKCANSGIASPMSTDVAILDGRTWRPYSAPAVVYHSSMEYKSKAKQDRTKQQDNQFITIKSAVLTGV